MSLRTEKIASVLKKDLAGILFDYQSNNMITITDVKVTPDLGIAKIYLSILGGDPEAVFAHIELHAGEIRFNLAKLIRNQVRRIPELAFYLDDTASYSETMETIFKKIHENEATYPKKNDEEGSTDESTKA